MKRSLLALCFVALPACGWVLGDIPDNPPPGDAAPDAVTGVGTPSSSSSTIGVGGAVGASGSGTGSGGAGVGGAGVGGTTGSGGTIGSGGISGVGGTGAGGGGAGGAAGAGAGTGGAAGTGAGGGGGAAGVDGGAGSGGAAGTNSGGSSGAAGNGGRSGSAGAGGSAGSSGASGAGGGTAGGGTAGTSGSGGTGGFVNDAGPDVRDAGDMCDMDGDGYKSLACPNGDDCDDNAPLVHPNQMTYFDEPTHPGGTNYDYNCNNVPEPRFGALNCGLLGLLCSQADSAFLGMTAPSCGQNGRFGHCVKSVLTCDEQPEQDSLTQPCR